MMLRHRHLSSEWAAMTALLLATVVAGGCGGEVVLRQIDADMLRAMTLKGVDP